MVGKVKMKLEDGQKKSSVHQVKDRPTFRSIDRACATKYRLFGQSSHFVDRSSQQSCDY